MAGEGGANFRRRGKSLWAKSKNKIQAQPERNNRRAQKNDSTTVTGLKTKTVVHKQKTGKT